MVEHGPIEPAERDDGVVLARNVVELLHRLDDQARWEALWEAFPRRSDRLSLIPEMERLLATITSRWPAMAQVRARGGHNPGMVILKLEPSLLAAVEDGLAEEGRSAPLCTGHAAFDALNRSLGARGVVANSRLKTIYIYLDPRTDVLFAALEYNKTAGVDSARPSYPRGDGSGIQALWSHGQWYVVFREAWGDCPSGCIYSELHYFVVHRDDALRVHHRDAVAIPEFVEILAALRWRRRGQAAHSDAG